MIKKALPKISKYCFTTLLFLIQTTFAGTISIVNSDPETISGEYSIITQNGFIAEPANFDINNNAYMEIVDHNQEDSSIMISFINEGRKVHAIRIDPSNIKRAIITLSKDEQGQIEVNQVQDNDNCIISYAITKR